MYYDFHIHSALSPCADDDMTPNNIVNMARLTGLDAIALSDHNCGDNLPAVAQLAADAGITFIPGIELNTSEEVHLLAYFNELEQAVRLGTLLYDALPDIENIEEYFGHQYVMDAGDNITGKKKKLLLSALPYGLMECCEMIREYGGVAVPAHVNKSADSLLANLGFFPPDIRFSTIEIWRGTPVDADISMYRALCNSDAHTLAQIAERENVLQVSANKREEIIKKLGAFPVDM